MKRKLLCTLLCMALVLGCLAVHVFAQGQSSKALDWGLTLRPDDITPTGMVVVVTQSGGNVVGQLEYGSAYHLQMRNGDVWVDVPRLNPDALWTLTAYGIPAESIYRMELDWSDLYGRLSSGHYRWVKTFWDFRSEPRYDEEAVFYVEFVITESHACLSKDGDQLCDTCLGIANHDCFDRDGDTECDLCGQKFRTAIISV